ncbi:2254_t:CDS:2 [Acaulospora morrowiae]|uniref:2254_t:CDS:1 n=1 Tax=Acaulospora morrowiae TaxID=94023 RepID=A0A9N9BMN5_9GLOM|nr:2254_t:CDS:2 [Acaulospora morrowiae]
MFVYSFCNVSVTLNPLIRKAGHLTRSRKSVSPVIILLSSYSSSVHVPKFFFSPLTFSCIHGLDRNHFSTSFSTLFLNPLSSFSTSSIFLYPKKLKNEKSKKKSKDNERHVIKNFIDINEIGKSSKWKRLQREPSKTLAHNREIDERKNGTSNNDMVYRDSNDPSSSVKKMNHQRLERNLNGEEKYKKDNRFNTKSMLTLDLTNEENDQREKALEEKRLMRREKSRQYYEDHYVNVDFKLLENFPAWLKGLSGHRFAPLFKKMRWQEIMTFSDTRLRNMGVISPVRRNMLKAFRNVKEALNKLDDNDPVKMSVTKKGEKKVRPLLKADTIEPFVESRKIKEKIEKGVRSSGRTIDSRELIKKTRGLRNNKDFNSNELVEYLNWHISRDGYDNNEDWSFANEKNFAQSIPLDPSQQQFWHQQFLKVDLNKLEIIENGNLLLVTIYPKLSLVLRFITNELCISLNNATEEVVIPLNQITKFKGPLNQREQISFDPSGGKLDGAQTIIFMPANWVDKNTIVFFGEGIRRLRFDQLRMNNFEKRESGIGSNSLGKEYGKDDGKELYITCSFLTKTFALQVSDSISFQEILNDIQMRYKIEVNPNRITYKNQVNDIITLIDEEDWQAAKWEAKRAKSFTICMYFS